MFDSQLELEFSPDKSTAGYRLHGLSVLNWGTFHNRVYTMNPDGYIHDHRTKWFW